GIEAVRGVEEVVGGLRRAADAGNLCDPVRLDREFEAGLDDGGRDRVVAAAGTQRRNLAFVVAVRVAERVLRQRRMMELRFDDVGHGSCMILISWNRPADRRTSWSRRSNELLPKSPRCRKRRKRRSDANCWRI